MNNCISFREEFSELLEKLTCGPLNPSEVIESSPSDTYLTGILWPSGVATDVADDSGVTDEDDANVPGYRSMKPCSLGITFSVKAGSKLLVGLGSTSRYVELDPSNIIDENENDKSTLKIGGVVKNKVKCWQHTLLSYSKIIDTNRPDFDEKSTNFLDPNGVEKYDSNITLHVRNRVKSGIATVTVTLINTAQESEDPASRDLQLLFQAQLEVSVKDPIGNPTWIVPRKNIAPNSADADTLSNLLIYRDVQEFAVGHGVSAVWPEKTEEGVTSVRTSWLPHHSLPGTSAEGHKSLANVLTKYPNLLAADWLQKAEKKIVLDSLLAFVECYKNWINDFVASRLASFKDHLGLAAQANFNRCNEAANRMSEGVICLSKNISAWEAFCLSNRAMDWQSQFAARGDRAAPLKWRPFQLAFMLLTIPSLVDMKRADRECMDLLWFPTGGGKTEAYLGLTAFQIFFRRLTSEIARKKGGVDVLMRYTLRLLTVQQFQRAAALISACEMMRLNNVRNLGNARITIGLYVGKETTPNSMADARDALQKESSGEKPKSTPRQLLTCPVCGNSLSLSSYRASQTLNVIDINCDAPTCPTYGGPLPVLMVDDCIFDAPTSLLIGTVDKFAQIPRKQGLGVIFGNGGRLPPGLIIQDELHLISGPLGSMAGLYESAIDIACTQNGIRPKIIGSTATIGRAESQVRALFDRAVMQFPPPGIDADDSFFAVKQTAEGNDRLYVGIPSAGRSPKFALQAVIGALLEAAQKLRAITPDPMVADPYWTCVAYFNSLRELGGAHVLVQDDVPRQMTFLSRRLNAASPRPMIKNPVAELSSRVSSREIPQMIQRLEARLDAGPMEEQAEDVVLASNMISVGVDVPRLGLMLVNGQPKSTSEYIQATSRVGRNRPGIVITLYNFGRPRDLSHFEHFKGYHSSLYRSVEATSVTPWAPRARDKALAAMLIGAVRQSVPGMSDDDAAALLQPNDPNVKRIVKEIARRCKAGSSGLEDSETVSELQEIVDFWETRAADARATGKRLLYWQKSTRFGNSSPHLLRSAEEAGDPGSLAWAAPGSLREVEPSAAFILRTT
jgi:hypothetical protein